MRRARWSAGVAGWAALGAAVLTGGGCGPNGFTPPPPPELAKIPDPTAADGARTVALILDSRKTPEKDVWEVAARQEAGQARAVLAVSRPMPNEPPLTQADLIRREGLRGATVLVVEPVNDPKVVQALEDVRRQGTPVVVVGPESPVTPVSGTAPVVTVAYESPEKTAAQVVDGLVKEAGGNGLNVKGHAVIAYNAASGPGTDLVARHVADALKARGASKVDVVTFEGDYQAGRDALKPKILADPEVTMVVGAEDLGLSALLLVLEELKDKRTFALAGYTTLDRTLNPNAITHCAVVVDRNVGALAREAVKAALMVSRGEKVDAVVRVPQPVHGRGTRGDDAPRPLPGGSRQKF